MKLRIRNTEEKDLPEIFSWFHSRKWPSPPIKDISPDFGMVAECDGVMIACAWYYLTGRSLAFIDWTGTNPEVDDQAGTEALMMIIEEIQKICPKVNPPVRALCFYTQNEKLAHNFEGKGFRKQNDYQRLLWTTKNS